MSTDLRGFTLEVCVDSVESALAAREGGATRLELCANLVIGGTTPPLSLLRAVKRATGLPVHALVRPRCGDFLYTEREFDLMLEDAGALLAAGADALVCGFLTPQGDLDGERLGKLVSLAHDKGKRFTLHRAFDMCRDPFAALELCRRLGVDSVLTSGQGASCLEGLPLLKKLWEPDSPVEILIGGGVSAAAIRRVREVLPRAASFHMSGKRALESGMQYRKEGVSMGLPGPDEFLIWRTDADAVRAARAALEESAAGQVPDWYGPFGGLTEEMRQRYVLCPRVFDEELSDCREVFRRELAPRVAGLTVERAMLEVNRWCAEHVAYRSTDDYTDSALQVYNRGYGRCGEESVFTVTALRSVGIAARQVYVPFWSHCDDNHAWVEAWDGRKWRYFGACEPEPELDRGWFTAAASRAMLVHAHYFVPGEAEPRCEPVTDRYTGGRTVQVTVLVLDGAGKPVPGADVKFQVLNMSDFLTVASGKTDGGGRAVCRLGLGSVLAAAHKDGLYGEALLLTAGGGAQQESRIILGEKRDCDSPTDFVFRAPDEQCAAGQPPLTDSEKRSRREVLDRCAGLREKWAARSGRRPEWERDGSALSLCGRESVKLSGGCILSLRAPCGQEALWRRNFSLSFLEGGCYRVSELSDIAAGEEKNFLLPEGRYRLVTCLRLPNGGQLARRLDFVLAPGERRRVALSFPQAREEDLFREVPLPTFPLRDPQGRERESRELFAERPLSLMFWLEPGREPTEHILNELLGAAGPLTAAGCGVHLVVEGPEAARDPALRRVLDSLPQARCWYGDYPDVFPALARRIFADPDSLPLVLLADCKAVCLYSCSGYNVGTAELLVRLLRLKARRD